MKEEILKEIKEEQRKITRRSIIIVIIVGIVIGSLSGVTAYSFSAKQVSFTPSNKAWKVNNVNDAIESLQLSKTSTNYSAEEQVVGTWIDDKPLYQKTITGIVTGEVNKTMTIADLSSYNIEYIASMYGTAKATNEYQVFMPEHWNDASKISIHFSPQKELQIIPGSDFSGALYAITIQYTKTTDSATTS